MTDFPFKMGWRPSLPDVRDVPYAQRFAASIPTAPLPRYVDLHHQCPPIWSQGNLGSCTGHGSSRAFAQDRAKLGQASFMPSRLFAYYNGRKLEGSTLIDAGATCRDVVKGIASWGLPPEELWPYDIKQFRKPPPPAAYNAAALHKAVEYNAVDNTNIGYVKAILAAGYTVIMGFTVYENFSDSTLRTGLVFMPEGRSRGGHCVCAVGYNSKNYICFANSWGSKVGDPNMPGHFWLPSQYWSNPNLASDFWVIRTVAA